MCFPPFSIVPNCRWTERGELTRDAYSPLKTGHDSEVRSWEPDIQKEVRLRLGHAPGHTLVGQAWDIFEAHCYAGRKLDEGVDDHMHNILLALTAFVSIVSGDEHKDLLRQYANLGSIDDGADAYQDAMLGLWERMMP